MINILPFIILTRIIILIIYINISETIVYNIKGKLYYNYYEKVSRMVGFIWRIIVLIPGLKLLNY